MTLYSSREGRLCIDGKRVPLQITRSRFSQDFFSSGDLRIAASKENIQIISQCFLDLYIVPMGGKTLPRGSGYTSQDIEQKYSINKKNPNLIDGDLENESLLFNPIRKWFRSRRNLTKGWCLLSCAALHRFFWQDFDLYQSKCPLDENDYHWWLQNQNGDVIDLAEEQYRIERIYELRQDGKKKGSFPGASYPVRGKNLAWKLAEYVSGSSIDPENIAPYISGYKSSQ
jgi:hypothetical protein